MTRMGIYNDAVHVLSDHGEIGKLERQMAECAAKLEQHRDYTVGSFYRAIHYESTGKKARAAEAWKDVIDHGHGYSTRYAHLHRIHVKEGQTVLRGTKIGEVGNTGKSTGPHLHYEVRINNVPVNPKYYFNNDLSVEEYEKIVTLAMKNK